MSEIILNRRQYLEFEKIAIGAFAPVSGFMDEDAFRGVVDTMRLPDGTPFPLPIVLDLDRQEAERIRGLPRVALVFQGEEVGEVTPESLFICDKDAAVRDIFGTSDTQHPGVELFHRMGKVFVGGPIQLKKRATLDISEYELTPDQTRALFADRGWKTVVGFQTRNVPHRAHEYLQRVALEMVDGLFIQPLIGRKKVGDFTPQAIIAGYRAMIGEFLHPDRVVLGFLSTFMRYSGPREAVFHAIIRRNYGCTHFVVGRDHAGVGDYYGKYEAHDLTRRFDGELGITVMRLHGPYYCAKCDGIVTEQTCSHPITAPEFVTEISGTDLRATLTDGAAPALNLMRPEVVASLKGIPIFISEDDE